MLLGAATPWLEVLVVVPAGILAGLSPIPVALLGFVGNAGAVLAILAGHERFERWRARRGRAAAASADASARAGPSKRRARAQRLLVRWGVPGLALVAPLLIGTHIATVLALAVRAPRRLVGAWMVGSLAAWVVGAAVVTWLAVRAA